MYLCLEHNFQVVFQVFLQLKTARYEKVLLAGENTNRGTPGNRAGQRERDERTDQNAVKGFYGALLDTTKSMTEPNN